MFSKATDYALRAILYLATTPDGPVTAEQIAGVTGVPATYLAKVLHGLSRAKIVNSQRGVAGGFRLALDPDELTLLDIVHAVDPIERIETCPMGNPEHTGGLCPLHECLDQIACQVEDSLRSTTIADLVRELKENTPGSPLICEFPRNPAHPAPEQ